MSHISTFMQVSLDGYFAGPNGELDWFKNNPDPEFEEFSLDHARSDGTLLFGRKTYEMMANAWPSDEAHADNPGMAEVMAITPKIVFSKSLSDVEEGERWQHVKLRREIDPAQFSETPAEDRFTVLGSGTIVKQFMDLSLIDEMQIVVNPVVLGSGRNAVLRR